MKRMLAMMLVVGAAGAVGCKKKQAAGSGSGSGTSSGSAAAAAIDAPPPPAIDAPAAPPPAIDAAAAAGPYVLPADATVVNEPDGKKADASGLGAALALHLVEKVAASSGDPDRHVDLIVAVTGSGTLAVDVGFSLDETAKYPDAGESATTLPPLSPPRPFQADDGGAPLAFKGPLLYVGHWRGSESGDDLAIGQDGDAVVVWRSQILDGESQPWFEQARVKLAAGAKVVAQ